MTSPHHHRRPLRLKDYDYAAPGAYFITMCTQNRACLFGEVVDDAMRLSAYGDIVWQCWEEIPMHFADVALDAFVVMPNHVHGIIMLTARRRAVRDLPVVPVIPGGAQHAAPLSGCDVRRHQAARLLGSGVNAEPA